MRVAVTGHRPRYWTNPVDEKKQLFKQLDLYFKIYPPKGDLVFLHGCALGVDMWFGEYAMENKIDLVLYSPFPVEVQVDEAVMGYGEIKTFRKQLNYAESVHVVSQTVYSQAYQKRNMVLVDNSDLVLGWYKVSRSGSGNCIRYANKVGTLNLNLRGRNL